MDDLRKKTECLLDGYLSFSGKSRGTVSAREYLMYYEAVSHGLSVEKILERPEINSVSENTYPRPSTEKSTSITRTPPVPATKKNNPKEKKPQTNAGLLALMQEVEG